jgi:hypothetical protein
MYLLRLRIEVARVDRAIKGVLLNHAHVHMKQALIKRLILSVKILSVDLFNLGKLNFIGDLWHLPAPLTRHREFIIGDQREIITAKVVGALHIALAPLLFELREGLGDELLELEV